MIDTCLFAVLYIHGHSYTSQKLYSNKNTELYWNNSVSSLWCVSDKYVKCDCHFKTTIKTAYDIQKEITVLPFESRVCYGIRMATMHSSEIPVFLSVPLRGWSWNDHSERAWLDLNLCSTHKHDIVSSG
jgi:hypothetical protein